MSETVVSKQGTTPAASVASKSDEPPRDSVSREPTASRPEIGTNLHDSYEEVSQGLEGIEPGEEREEEILEDEDVELEEPGEVEGQENVPSTGIRVEQEQTPKDLELDDEKEAIYENFFLQFGSAYLLTRIIIGLNLFMSLVLCLLTTVVLASLIPALRRRRASRGLIAVSDKPTRTIVLAPEAIEGFLRNEQTPVDIEFVPESGEVKVIVE